MAFPNIEIGGQEVTVDFGSLTVADRVGERSTASFVAWDPDGTLGALSEGQPVTVHDPAGAAVFRGFVASLLQTKPHPDDPAVRWQVSCVDFHYTADKRLVADAWRDTNCHDIIQDIVTNVLYEEGVRMGTVVDGPTLVETVFGYVPASRALSRLADMTGHVWWIDGTMHLHFVEASGTATGTVSRDDCRYAPFLKHSSPDYRNRQFIKGAHGYTDSRTESFLGDGTQTTFTVAYPLGKVPAVTVNGVARTVGIRSVDVGKDWYWSKNEAQISQDAAATPLSTGDVLAVTYVGLYPIVAAANDFAEQHRRQIVEGVGTGKVEALTEMGEVFGRPAAFDAANGLLRTYATEGRELTFTTGSQYTAGQFVTVNLPELGVAGDTFLVTQVSTRDLSRSEWEYAVTAVDGPDAGSWQNRLAVGLRPPELLSLHENIEESETLLVFTQYAEQWPWQEAFSESVWSCPVPALDLYPSTSLYPC